VLNCTSKNAEQLKNAIQAETGQGLSVLIRQWL